MLAESVFRPLAGYVRRPRLIPACLAAWTRLRRLPGAGGTVTARAPVPPRQLRPVLVPGSLSDLAGPRSGVVELPVTLYWSGSGVFNLGDRHEAVRMYLAVLDAARSLHDLTAYLNGDLLVELWPELRLARVKRAAWETRFSELRPAAEAA